MITRLRCDSHELFSHKVRAFGNVTVQRAVLGKSIWKANAKIRLIPLPFFPFIKKTRLRQVASKAANATLAILLTTFCQLVATTI